MYSVKIEDFLIQSDVGVTASEEIKDVSAVLKSFKQNDWERELSEIKEQKNQCQLLIPNL